MGPTDWLVANKRSKQSFHDLKHGARSAIKLLLLYTPSRNCNGAERMLGEIDMNQVRAISINAIDHRFDALLSVPYIINMIETASSDQRWSLQPTAR